MHLLGETETVLGTFGYNATLLYPTIFFGALIWTMFQQYYVTNLTPLFFYMILSKKAFILHL